MRRIGDVFFALLLATTIVQPVLAAGEADKPAMTDEEVARLFGATCGWCHEEGGRKAGRGPQLMNTTRSDDYMINRIATGSPGKMPAFGGAFSYEQIQAIIHYIRNLKPDQATQGKP